MQQTRLSRRWLMKIVIFLVAATALGLWGLFDATIAYPERGRAYAEYMEHQYLMAMGQSGLPVLPIKDPEQLIAEMEAGKADLEAQRATAEAAGQNLQVARISAGLTMLQWLKALKLVGDLDEEHTTITNPNERFSELSARWQSRDQPKPLSALDIPMQWGFVLIGFGLDAYLLLLIVMVGSKKHRYDPEEKRLTFPDGVSILPGDIEDINKRKWDKFIVQIKTGGKWRKMDLLRYDPLEEWFLDMEKETSFYEPPEDDSDDDAASPFDEAPNADGSAPSEEEPAAGTA